MRVVVDSSKYSDTFDISVSELDRDEAVKIRTALDKIQKLIPEPEHTPMGYEDPSLWSVDKAKYMEKIVRWAHNSPSEHSSVTEPSKIMTIKFLRTISNLGLKDAKDFVEYAIGVGAIPAWVSQILNRVQF